MQPARQKERHGDKQKQPHVFEVVFASWRAGSHCAVARASPTAPLFLWQSARLGEAYASGGFPAAHCARGCFFVCLYFLLHELTQVFALNYAKFNTKLGRTAWLE